MPAVLVVSDIPGAVRAQIRGRDRHLCARCGMRGAEIHHRRTRRVRDEHTHCPCNLIYLCGWGNHEGCHGWAHSNPFEARSLGLIVSRFAVPARERVFKINEGWMLLGCEGQTRSLEEA